MPVVDDFYTQAMFGQWARRGGAWLYVRNHGEGVVSFTGASKMQPHETEHPFLYDSPRDVRFIRGEVVIRPVEIVATDIFHGYTTGQLLTDYHDVERMIYGNGDEPVGEYVLRDEQNILP